MFCRNCGKELAGTPDICLGCGARPLAGRSFCYSCGAPTNPLAEICVSCGVRLAEVEEKEDISAKSRLATTLLCMALPLVLPIHGIHRFYLGKIGTGILMLITFGGLYIWTLIDFVYAVSGNMKDKEGKPIRNW